VALEQFVDQFCGSAAFTAFRRLRHPAEAL